MSAHWYWDWDWGRGGGGTRPALTKPGDPVSTHKPNEPAPFPFPTGKPCEKIQVYAGTFKGPPNPPLNPTPPAPWPQDVVWSLLGQQEVANCDDEIDTSDWVSWYWVACRPVGDCCKGNQGCEYYRITVQLPKKSGEPKGKYLHD